ncbi:MAG TPA: OmpA family protein [Chitinophagaceae bacterium]|jgi:outer membrane protein OmpA-like peptidoglycan-associated protein|nr:OmpA family protein [Chitinophagaceae bacterium]
MKPIFIIAALVITLPFFADAQLRGLMNKVKSKVEQRVDNKTDQQIDKTLDEIEGKKTTTATGDGNSVSANTQQVTEESSVKSFSKFDFVPGERILYSEDFSQDAIGELPLTWNSSGKGEVMTLSAQQGKWLRIFQNNTYLTGNTKSYGDNYTIEFDLMYFFEPKVKGYVLPGWSVGLFSSGGADGADNKFLKEHSEFNSSEIKFGFGSYALAVVESKLKRAQTFVSDKMELGEPTKDFNKLVHYSIQVQKSRLRVWVNERKVFDIPRAINTADTLNQMFFKMDGSNYKEDEIGLFVSNIKVATGLPDTRHKLIEEGKFSTTGILFDVNSDKIKPNSYGVIKEIADVLQKFPGTKVKIIGHTDSDGGDADNLGLSKKRSAAVKDMLVKEFSIDASRIETDGKGEIQPVDDNKTKEGKAANRRVEFVKQ